MPVFIGCAGWALDRRFAELFPGDGTHLERYARRFHCVEINSSFYRPHQPKTYLRWADSTPAGFRFAVKMPKRITHERRLVGVDEPLERFVSEVQGLGEKLGPILVQLPPSLGFAAPAAERFFEQLRQRVATPIVCEPRHRGWFTPEADALLARFRVARVAADPAPVPAAAEPGGSSDLAYFRLHGSPRIYYSAYSPAELAERARQLTALAATSAGVWCIFDNTALGAAVENALGLQTLLAAGPPA
jgi:uncharacterized protein YecE (DUF72 family)